MIQGLIKQPLHSAFRKDSKWLAFEYTLLANLLFAFDSGFISRCSLADHLPRQHSATIFHCMLSATYSHLPLSVYSVTTKLHNTCRYQGNKQSRKIVLLNTKRYPQYKSKKYAIYQITVFSSLITALHIPFRFFKTLGKLKISRQISEKDAELTRRII